VRLFRQVGCPANDVILSFFYLADKGSAFVVDNNFHPIAHGYRIGASNAFEPEITFDFAFYNPVVGCLYLIPASGISDY
jgi:hypothetical protein